MNFYPSHSHLLRQQRLYMFATPRGMRPIRRGKRKLRRWSMLNTQAYGKMSLPPLTFTGHKNGPFWDHETVARACSRFITHLFTCPVHPPPGIHSRLRLPRFIACVLHRAKQHPSVTFAALILLRRLRHRLLNIATDSGRRLFTSAFMTASKTVCNDPYLNKPWAAIAQGTPMAV
jgi:hypothetical protein